jgi:hypothetical protein
MKHSVSPTEENPMRIVIAFIIGFLAVYGIIALASH